jgi:hypothetical protein
LTRQRNTTTGQVAIWFMNGTTLSGGGSVGVLATMWTIAATGDYNGDGKSDLLWHDTFGNTAIWLMDARRSCPAARASATWIPPGPFKAPTRIDAAQQHGLKYVVMRRGGTTGSRVT